MERKAAGLATGTQLNAQTFASVVNVGRVNDRDRVNIVSTSQNDVTNGCYTVAVVATFLTRHVLEGDVNGVVRDSSRSLVERSHYALVEIHFQFVLTGRNTEGVVNQTKRILPSGMVEQDVVVFACIAVSVYIVPTALVVVLSQCVEECEVASVVGEGEDALEYVVLNVGQLDTLSRIPTGVVANQIHVLYRDRHTDVNLVVRSSAGDAAVVSGSRSNSGEIATGTFDYIYVACGVKNYVEDVVNGCTFNSEGNCLNENQRVKRVAREERLPNLGVSVRRGNYVLLIVGYED